MMRYLTCGATISKGNARLLRISACLAPCSSARFLDSRIWSPWLAQQTSQQIQEMWAALWQVRGNIFCRWYTRAAAALAQLQAMLTRWHRHANTFIKFQIEDVRSGAAHDEYQQVLSHCARPSRMGVLASSSTRQSGSWLRGTACFPVPRDNRDVCADDGR